MTTENGGDWGVPSICFWSTASNAAPCLGSIVVHQPGRRGQVGVAPGPVVWVIMDASDHLRLSIRGHAPHENRTAYIHRTELRGAGSNAQQGLLPGGFPLAFRFFGALLCARCWDSLSQSWDGKSRFLARLVGVTCHPLGVGRSVVAPAGRYGDHCVSRTSRITRSDESGMYPLQDW